VGSLLKSSFTLEEITLLTINVDCELHWRDATHDPLNEKRGEFESFKELFDKVLMDRVKGLMKVNLHNTAGRGVVSLVTFGQILA